MPRFNGCGNFEELTLCLSIWRGASVLALGALNRRVEKGVAKHFRLVIVLRYRAYDGKVVPLDILSQNNIFHET